MKANATALIGTRAVGWNLGLLWMEQNGRSWALVEVDENRIITDVFFAGSRAKVAQEGAKMTGRLVYFWYEVITELHSDMVRLTPVQVSQLARLSYKDMVYLNVRMAESCGTELDRFLRRYAA